MERKSSSLNSGWNRSIHGQKKYKIEHFNTSFKIIPMALLSGRVNSSIGVCPCMEMESPIVTILKMEIIMLRFKIKTWVFSELNGLQTLTIQPRLAEELSMGLFTRLHELV